MRTRIVLKKKKNVLYTDNRGLQGRDGGRLGGTDSADQYSLSETRRVEDGRVVEERGAGRDEDAL